MLLISLKGPKMTKTSDQEVKGGKRKSTEDFEEEHDSETSDEEEEFEKPEAANKKRKGRKHKECSTTLQAKWDEMFNRLVDFRKRMGHCLGKFVSASRFGEMLA
jgi:TATA-binding protein-associated factor Taf7